MHTDGEKVHVSETEASGGSKEGVVRWVLVIGLVLAIALLSIIWMTGAATQDDVESEATVTGRMDAQAPDTDTSTGAASDTDSIVTENADAADTPSDGEAADTPLQTVDN